MKKVLCVLLCIFLFAGCSPKQNDAQTVSCIIDRVINSRTISVLWRNPTSDAVTLSNISYIRYFTDDVWRDMGKAIANDLVTIEAGSSKSIIYTVEEELDFNVNDVRLSFFQFTTDVNGTKISSDFYIYDSVLTTTPDVYSQTPKPYATARADKDFISAAILKRIKILSATDGAPSVSIGDILYRAKGNNVYPYKMNLYFTNHYSSSFDIKDGVITLIKILKLNKNGAASEIKAVTPQHSKFNYAISKKTAEVPVELTFADNDTAEGTYYMTIQIHGPTTKVHHTMMICFTIDELTVESFPQYKNYLE